MARIRSIKPEFPQSESIGRLSRDARLLFIQLWTLVDDAGRTRAASRMLASLLYPYDDDARGLMDGWLEELELHGRVRLYMVEGAQYLEIVNWLEHQKIDHPSKSRLPPCPDKFAKPREASRSLDADLGPRTKEGKGKERKKEEEGEPKKRADARYAYEGVVIKLSAKNLEQWTKAFGHLDLLAELTARDAFLASPKATDEDRSNWFISTSTHFRNLNQRSKEATEKAKPQNWRSGIEGVL